MEVVLTSKAWLYRLTLGMRWEYSLRGAAVHHWAPCTRTFAHTFRSSGSLESAVQLTPWFWEERENQRSRDAGAVRQCYYLIMHYLDFLFIFLLDNEGKTVSSLCY